MRLPRWWHRLYAESMGYFWLPCPMCGEMFGGHESSDEATPDDRVVCRACAVVMRRGRERFMTHERVPWDRRFERMREIGETCPEHPYEPGYFAAKVEVVAVGAPNRGGTFDAEIVTYYEQRARPEDN
jgi:hypothetical protein